MNQLLTEIYAQPDALRQTLAHVTPELQAEFRRLTSRRTIITGMGSSYSAAYFAGCLLSERLNIDITAVEASELLDYQRGLLNDATLIMISQSGRSAEIVELLAHVRGPLIGISNHADSPLVKASDLALLTHAGEEYAASTKTYTSALALLLALSGIYVDTLPEMIEHYLPIWDDAVSKLAARYRDVRRVVLIGRGPSYASAMTGALLLQEAAKMPAQSFSGGQFNHGPIEAFDHDTLYVIFAPTARTQAHSLKLAQTVLCLGGKVVTLGGADSDVPLPALDEGEGRESLLNVIPVQLLAAWLGMIRVAQVDVFRYGQKVVAHE
ncbi:MAG: SIS domain-containing protein [Burkholderiales bacterium]|nr:SIS domain-containing protein [Anaerolineae bacterium]